MYHSYGIKTKMTDSLCGTLRVLELHDFTYLDEQQWQPYLLLEISDVTVYFQDTTYRYGPCTRTYFRHNMQVRSLHYYILIHLSLMC